MTYEPTLVSHCEFSLLQGSHIQTHVQADSGPTLLSDWGFSDFPRSAIGPDAPWCTQSDHSQIYTVSPRQYLSSGLCSVVYFLSNMFDIVLIFKSKDGKL